MLDVVVSMVLFNSPGEQVLRAVRCALSSNLNVKIYLIDNSADDSLKDCAIDKRVEYIHNGKNIGFGSAHNIAIRKSLDKTKYNLILNADVYFESDVLSESFQYMEQNKNVGQLAAKTLYPNGELQPLCKMLPTPFDLVARRFIPGFLQPVFRKRLDAYVLKHKSYDQVMKVPNLSGSYMFIRNELLKKVQGFDENIFLYTEDLDLTRRINQIADTVYNPAIKIYHEYGKGSYISRKLLIYHMKSAVYYFNKWGWFFDKKRVEINRKLK